MSDLVILAGNGNSKLANDIAAQLGLAAEGNAVVSTFPDGESMIKLNANVRGRDTFIIQPTCPPTNNNLMELLLMIDAAKRASAERITAVIPFYGYARQDRKDQPRVPISAKLVANMIVAAGAHRVLTMDLHAAQIQGFFDIPVDHLYGLPLFHNRLSAELGQFVAVSPDLGGMKRAAEYNKAFKNCDSWAVVSKERTSATDTKAQFLVGDVKDQRCLIVDDMTESAGTIIGAAQLLKDYGAKQVNALVTHALIDNPIARQRLHRAFIEGVVHKLYCTDTVPLNLERKDNVDALYWKFVEPVSAAGLFAEAIRRIHNKESVTQLFELR